MSYIEWSARARLRRSAVVALLIGVTGVAGSVAQAADGEGRLLPGTPLRLILEAAFSEGGSSGMASEYADRYINLPCWSQRWTQSTCVIACTSPTNFPWARLRGGAACAEIDAQCFRLSIQGKQVSRPCDTPGQMSCDCLPLAGDCPAWNIQCFDLNGPHDCPSCN